MSASPARIAASKANGAKSKGPMSCEGKSISRLNSLKHGLTGKGVILPEADVVEVERLRRAFESDMKPTTEAGRTLIGRMAILSVRMERCVAQETASLSERVRKAEAEFEAPEGLDEDSVEQLRAEASDRALFDPSKEACLARKYEAAAERGFFRALKEFRQVEKAAKAQETVSAVESLGSFLPVESFQSMIESLPPAPAPKPPSAPSKPVVSAPKPFVSAPKPSWGGSSFVPITVGRPR